MARSWAREISVNLSNSLRDFPMKLCVFLEIHLQIAHFPQIRSVLIPIRHQGPWRTTKFHSITPSWSQTWSQTCSELEFGLLRTI